MRCQEHLGPFQCELEELPEHKHVFDSKVAVTAGPRPVTPHCPRCQSGFILLNYNLWVDDGKRSRHKATCQECEYELTLDSTLSDFLEFFAAAPAEDARPTNQLIEACWAAVSKLESQVARNKDLPPVYAQIVTDAFAALRQIEKLLPEDVQLDVELEKQQEIDISNLRFYSRMADENDWDAVEISNSVIVNTLHEIADRLALLRRVSAPEVVFEFSSSPCGHSSQYAYTEDGGKNIVCLVCERRVSGKGAQDCTENWRCGQCGAYFNTKPSGGCYLCDAGPEQFEYAPASPAPVPATPEPRLDLDLELARKIKLIGERYNWDLSAFFAGFAGHYARDAGGAMSKTIEHEGSLIARTNRMFFTIGSVGEVDEKGKTVFAVHFKGKRIAEPDRPLMLMVGFIQHCIVSKFAYSSSEECAKDIAIFKEYAAGLSAASEEK